MQRRRLCQHTPMHMALESSTLKSMCHRESNPAEWHIFTGEVTATRTDPRMHRCIISSTYFSFIIASWLLHHRKSHQLGFEAGCDNKLADCVRVHQCVCITQSTLKLTLLYEAKCADVYFLIRLIRAWP